MRRSPGDWPDDRNRVRRLELERVRTVDAHAIGALGERGNRTATFHPQARALVARRRPVAQLGEELDRLVVNLDGARERLSAEAPIAVAERDGQLEGNADGHGAVTAVGAREVERIRQTRRPTVGWRQPDVWK